ncbi:hypothetical protein EHV15_05385 [Paenibacillus oralis]|uniref:Uncharacterized protein n=1 Tax=Paenibacillus oralis TaxID=2490856 RepID=A0A3P3TXL1_9BACL|nr:hypothetical protein [Paenibacillus oralis]RRJ62446.1 hypothetical protein EHV15_05385 [Paenibacillus oralis]
MILTDDEKKLIIWALEARAAQSAGHVHAFQGKEQYEKYYKESLADLEKTVDLIKKLEEVPF